MTYTILYVYNSKNGQKLIAVEDSVTRDICHAYFAKQYFQVNITPEKMTQD